MPTVIQAKTILNKTKGRDPWFLDDYTVNPYSGCSFNCLFCYIRGSKYGTHMEEKLSIKGNAAELLDKQLAIRARKGQYGIIVLSSATDPYLQFEREEQLTRRLLEVILRHRFPVHIVTRSNLVTRDFDLLQAIDREAILPKDLEPHLQHRTMITFSFSTLDDAIAHIFEPGATAPSLRLEALKQSLAAGFLSGVSLMPLIPYITDTSESLHALFNTFRTVKAHYVMPAGITLFGHGPSDSRTLMLRAVEKHYPQLLDKYRRFFGTETEMPAYYRQAFHKKMLELGAQYGLRNRIIQEA